MKKKLLLPEKHILYTFITLYTLFVLFTLSIHIFETSMLTPYVFFLITLICDKLEKRNGKPFFELRISKNKKSILLINFINFIIFVATMILIWLAAPSIIQAIFDIGRQVGQALAKWF